jgi:hypothetical protein
MSGSLFLVDSDIFLSFECVRFSFSILFLLLYYIACFHLHCLTSSLFIEFTAHHLQVSDCCDPVHPGHFGSQSFFFLLSLPQLLLILLFSVNYLNSQPTFRKHVYPQQFGDDNLSPPCLFLARTAHTDSKSHFPSTHMLIL